jgi:tape measure domain-containing protein
MASKSEIEAGRAYVLVQLRENLDQGIAQLRSKLKVVSRELTEYGRSVAKLGLAISSAFGSAIASLAAPIKIAADIEQTTAEFAALTGSVKVAAGVISELRTLAAKTPLTFRGLAKETRTLLAFGIGVRNATHDIRVLAEVAGGDQVRLERLALAFGQVAAKGRLMATEVRQFTESGFNPLQEIARTTTADMGQLLDQMANGQVSFEDVRGAFISATSEGGRFNSLLLKMSQTTKGLITTLGDSVKIAVEPLGQALLPVINDILRQAIHLTNQFGEWASANQDVAFTVFTLGTAGLAAGVSITAVGAAVLVAGKSLEAFNDVVLRGAKLLLKLMDVGAGSGPATVAIKTVAAEAEDMSAAVAVSSKEAQLSMSGLGRSFVAASKAGRKALAQVTVDLGKTTRSVGSFITRINKHLMRLGAGLNRSIRTFAKHEAAVHRTTSRSMKSVTAFCTEVDRCYTASLGAVSRFSASFVAQMRAVDTAIVATIGNVANLKATLASLAIPNLKLPVGRARSAPRARPRAATKATEQAATKATEQSTSRMKKNITKSAKVTRKHAEQEFNLAEAFKESQPQLTFDELISSGEAETRKKMQQQVKALQEAFPDLKVPELPTFDSVDALIASAEANAQRARQLSNPSLGDLLLAGMVIPPALPKDLFKSTRKAAASVDELIETASRQIAPPRPQASAYVRGLLASAEEAADAAGELRLQPEDLRLVPLDRLLPEPDSKRYVRGILSAAEEAADAAGELKLAPATALRGAGSIDDIAAEALGLTGTSGVLKKDAARYLGQAEEAVHSARRPINRAMTGLGDDFAMVSADIAAGLAPNFLSPVKKSAGVIRNSFSSVFGGITRIFTQATGKLGGLARTLMAPFVSAVGPVIAWGVAIAAVAGGVAYLANRAGVLAPIFEAVKSSVLSFVDLVSRTFRGITTAINIGEWGTAMQIAWAGVKVAFIRGVDAIVQSLPSLTGNVLDFIYKMGVALVDTIVDIFKAIPQLIKAAFSGGQSVANIFLDIFEGNFSDGTLQNVRRRWEGELDELLDSTNKKQKAITEQNQQRLAQEQRTSRAEAHRKAMQESNQLAAIESAARIQEHSRRIVENMRMGVAAVAAGLSSEEIAKVNAASRERATKLRDEIRELQQGKHAADQYRMAVSGVTVANRLQIAALERSKKALEVSKALKTRIQALREESLAARIGAEAAERLKFARQGGNKALIEELRLLQQQKAYRDTRNTLMEEINTLRYGADATERLQLARQGLTKAQIDEIQSLRGVRDSLTEMTNEASRLNDQFKDPVKAFRESQAKISRLQRMGLISQEVAAKAQTAAIRRVEEETKRLKPKQANALFDEDSRREFMQRLRERAVEMAAQQRGRQIAQRDQKAADQARIKAKTNAPPVTPFQRRQERAWRDQTQRLDEIVKNTGQPNEVVSIR